VSTLRSAVASLAETRAALAAMTETLATARAEWNAAHETEIRNVALLQQAVTRQEADVRALALTAYRETEDPHPAPGVSVRLYEALRYDAAEAMAWATKTGMAITPAALDRKAFEKIAKATPLPFVTYADEPRALIAADLDAALDGERGTESEAAA